MVVTVDGPSGAGKSTVSKEAARLAGLPHLDTGAFYRAAALAVLRAAADPSDEAEAERVVAEATFEQVDGVMYLNGEDVSVETRSEAVTTAVSQVSAHPGVRRLMVEIQRAWADRHDRRAVVEGRDIGSVVFPAAALKIYLDASPEVRARRRALDDGADPRAVLADQTRRDRLDSTRRASPLTVPEGAVVIDTSDLTFDEVVAEVLHLIDPAHHRRGG